MGVGYTRLELHTRLAGGGSVTLGFIFMIRSPVESSMQECVPIRTILIFMKWWPAALGLLGLVVSCVRSNESSNLWIQSDSVWRAFGLGLRQLCQSLSFSELRGGARIAAVQSRQFPVLDKSRNAADSTKISISTLRSRLLALVLQIAGYRHRRGTDGGICLATMNVTCVCSS